MKGEEILTCLILVVIGYFIAKMFSRTCNGFRVGGDKYQCLEYIQGMSECCDQEKNNCPQLKNDLNSSFPYYCDKDCSESFDKFKTNCI